MSLIPALVQELLKIFLGGGKRPPGGIGLTYFENSEIISLAAKFNLPFTTSLFNSL